LAGTRWLVRELLGGRATVSRNGAVASGKVRKANSTRRKEARASLREIADRAAAEAERQTIRLALQATRGNKSQAARLLQVDYKTLHLKMKRYEIEAREFRAS